MNDETDNNRWVLAAAAAIAALFLVMLACAAGAVGGYLIARAQFNQSAAASPPTEQLEPAVPSPEVLPEGFRRGLPDELPFEFDLPEGFENLSGALVREVVPGSPADEAGLQPGDLITAVNGEAITVERSLADLIGQFRPGDTVELSYLPRMNPAADEEVVQVTLASREDNPDQSLLGVSFVPFFMDFEMRIPEPD